MKEVKFTRVYDITHAGRYLKEETTLNSDYFVEMINNKIEKNKKKISINNSYDILSEIIQKESEWLEIQPEEFTFDEDEGWQEQIFKIKNKKENFNIYLYLYFELKNINKGLISFTIS